MKKILVLSLLFILSGMQLNAQKYFTRSGKVSFHSKAMLENIDAINKQGTFVLDESSRKIQMAVLIKAFQFEKALMQEHFNENYMESDQYPKAIFKGEIVAPLDFSLSREGSIQACKIEGSLTIHGVTQNISTDATFTIENNNIHASASFPVKVQDYEIDIPSLVKDKIAKELVIRIDLDLDKM